MKGLVRGEGERPMSPPPPRTTKYPRQIVVRITDDLHAWLEADADEHGRTVAQSTRFHLRRAMTQTGGPT